MTTTYRSYLLRLWLESNDPPVWRAILESPVNGERHGFTDLQTLYGFLEQDAKRLAAEAQATQNNDPGGELKYWCERKAGTGIQNIPLSNFFIKGERI